MLATLHEAELELDVDGVPEPNPERDAAILRIAQEAVHNALRHAGATHVHVHLSCAADRPALDVTDDGRGFVPADPELRSRHLGLTSMEQRAHELGGHLVIRSAPGDGTSVRLYLGGRP